MAIVEGAIELLGIAVRFAVWLFVEIFIELIVKRTGHLVLRLIGRKDALDSTAAMLVGAAVWAVLAASCFVAVRMYFSG